MTAARAADREIDHATGRASGPTIDLAAHEHTYRRFIEISKVGAITCFNILALLILFGFGSGFWATFFGVVMLFATLIAATIGIASGSEGWKPPMVVFAIHIVLIILFVA